MVHERDGFQTATWDLFGLSDSELWLDTLSGQIPVESLGTKDETGRAPHPHETMSRSISLSYRAIVMRHFGLGCESDARRIALGGVQMAKKMFANDWITEFESPSTQWSREQLLHRFDKRRPNNVRWLWAFFESATCCLVSGCHDDFCEIADWVEPTLSAEYLGGRDETEIGVLYVILCHDVLGKSLPNRSTLEEQIRSARARRPKLLLDAWNAALAENQSEFEKAFTAAVKDYGKRHKPKCLLVDAVAVHHSIIWMLASERGLALPTRLDKRHRAMFVTADSLRDMSDE